MSAEEAARIILEAGAVYTRTEGEPFFFSSGWASPVFVDVKRLISLPEARDRLIDLALARIDAAFPPGSYAQIAGCELAGVPFAAIVADRRHLPLVVVMKQEKGFGRLAQIEGRFAEGTATLLLDDLTTDGRSKVRFRRALEAAGAEVRGIFVLLDYGVFPGLSDIRSLVGLRDILAAARGPGRLDPAALAVFEAFVADAPGWSRAHGGIAQLPERSAVR
ncbi:MAG: orotate phosphoribosyltransferase [Paracoccaceae bacterium]